MPFVPDGAQSHPSFVPDSPAQNQDQGIAANFQKAWNYNPSEAQKMEAAEHPITGMEDPAYQVAGMFGPNAPLTGVSNLIKKPGDFLMQKAAGLKKYIPGLGEKFADAGLIGTKGMMKSQVASGLAKSGQQIGDLASTIPSLNTAPVAEKLGEQASKLVGPDGKILTENMPAFNKFSRAASEASQEGSLSGEAAAARRSQYGKIAENAGSYRDNPSQALKSQLARTQQAGYSEALKNAPGGPAYADAIKDADSTYSTLSKAGSALNAPESLSSFGMAAKALPVVTGGTIGYQADGAKGAALGAFLGTPLGMSLAGRGLIGTGKIAQKLPVGTVPLTLQQLLGKDSK